MRKTFRASVLELYNRINIQMENYYKTKNKVKKNTTYQLYFAFNITNDNKGVW